MREQVVTETSADSFSELLVMVEARHHPCAKMFVGESPPTMSFSMVAARTWII